MVLPRAISWLARSCLGVMLLAPALALVPATVLDQGPDGRVRVSAFPLALTAFDPFIWTCVRNSVAVAALVAIGSMILGVRISRILARQRFWGRPVLAAMIMAPAVIPPAFLALGLLGQVGPARLRQWDAIAVSLSNAGGILKTLGWRDGWAWALWFWAALAQGVALVTIVTTSAFSRIDPAWEDAARLTGAGPRQIWRRLIWPLIRPAVARTTGLVFILTLADPGAPLVLGLRRTLAFQIVGTAMKPDPFPRAATLGLIGLALALCGRLLLRWWGGTSGLADRGATPSRDFLIRRSNRRSWFRSFGSSALLGAWASLAWLPILTLALLALSAPSEPQLAGTLEPFSGRELTRRLTAPPVPRLFLNSVLIGLGLIGLLRLLAFASLHSNGSSGNGLARKGPVFSASMLPPLVVGLGVLAIPRLLELSSLMVGANRGWERASRVLDQIARVMGQDYLPGLLLFLGISLTYASRFLLIRGEPDGDGEESRSLSDLEILAGVRRGRVNRPNPQGRHRVPLSGLLLTAVLATSAVSPSVLLSRNLESWTIGPGFLVLANQNHEAQRQAAAMALGATVVNLVVLGIFSFRRSVPASRLTDLVYLV